MRSALLALIVAAAPAAALAEEHGHGQALFMTHCAACHGAEANGDGPMSGLITVAVPGLKGISAANDGTFPMARIVQTIDGRVALRGHGGPMLVYGQILGGGSAVVDAPDGSPIETRGDIVSLAEYLASIQE
jgi:mono/diheme cytochrome c family protein